MSYYPYNTRVRHYGGLDLLVDIFALIVTSGLWLIRIFVREMRFAKGERPYTIIGWIFDTFMALITGGLWLIWVIFRELR